MLSTTQLHQQQQQHGYTLDQAVAAVPPRQQKDERAKLGMEFASNMRIAGITTNRHHSSLSRLPNEVIAFLWTINNKFQIARFNTELMHDLIPA